MRGRFWLGLGRLPFEQMAVSLLTLASVALLGLVLAYWTWVWFAPTAEPRVRAAPFQSSGVAPAGEIFGVAHRKQTAAAPTGIAIRLLGVVAASGNQPGYAVVQLDAKRILAVLEGNEIDPGVRLAEVHPNYVILERGGARERLEWPKRQTTAAPVTTKRRIRPR
jgi:general secretion pathway protein C